MTGRRPARPSASRVSSIAYAPLAAEDDDADDYMPARPAHTRENSRSALLARSVRSLRQVPALANPVQLDELNEAGAGDVKDARVFRNADGQELDVQQRKMALVSDALEDTGMGRYQWSMYVAFMLDLLF